MENKWLRAKKNTDESALVEKRCTKCLKVLPVNRFRQDRKNKKVFRYLSSCEACRREGNELRRVMNLKRDLDNKRSRNLERKYGITLEEYKAILDTQQGKCAICGAHHSEFDKKLFVDHDHETGKVRGLLCLKCNYGVGLFNDDINIAIRLVKYLESHGVRKK